MPDGHTLEDEVKPPAETQEESTWSNSPFLDFGNPSPSPSRPSSLPPPSPPPSPPGGDQPSQSPHDHGDRPGSQSSGQASSSDSGKQSDTGSDKSENETKSQKPTSNQPSTPDFPPDIEWSPEDEPSGLIPFIQAAAEGARDGSEDKTTVVCEALYRADPEGVARAVKFMTGYEPDEEQDVLPAFISLARSVGLDEYLTGAEAWYTTRLGPTEPFAATATDDEQLSGLSQPEANASADEVPEINILAQNYLSETESEWNQAWTEKEELANKVLIPKLNRFIDDFDENSVNWEDFTLLESIDFYERQIAGKLYALSTSNTVSEEDYQRIHAELDWAAELRSLAEPKALDYTEVYAESFAGTVHVPDAEHERRHVVDQLALIHEELNITIPDDYFESRSTRDLKHDLAYLLQDEVLPFVRADENEEGNRIGQFYRRYQLVARDTPENVLRRLTSSYKKHDVVGFFFMMGFLGVSVLSEPIDWAVTSVDVTDALLRGDLGSAGLHTFFGGAPVLKSPMVHGLKHLGRTPLVRLLPAKVGWTTRQTEALTQGKIVVPGSKKELHQKLVDLHPEQTIPRYNLDWRRKRTSDETKISSNAENQIYDLFKELEYEVIIHPTESQLKHPKIDYKGAGNPDFVIEGQIFDAYSPRTSSPSAMITQLQKKLKRGQADSFILDITEPVTESYLKSDVTLHESSQKFMENIRKQLKPSGKAKLLNIRGGLDLKELWIRNHDQLIPFAYVENNHITVIWP